MAGPGGSERGRISVRVLPDTSAFARSLGRYLERIERTHVVTLPLRLDPGSLDAEVRRAAALAQRTARVDLPVEVDGTRARIEARALAAEISRTSKARIKVDTRDFAVAGRALAGLAGAGLAQVGSQVITAGLLAVASAAATAAGSLGLLPAAYAATGAAAATLLLGLRGFGEALSNLGDPAKFSAALANLAPAARDTAVAIRDLVPAFDGMRLDVQQALFAGLAEQVKRLGGAYLPVLRAGLVGIAAEFNTGARAVADFAAAPQSLADTATVLAGTRAALAALVPAGIAVAQALRDIAAVGSGFLPGLAAGLTGLAQRFAEFIAQARASGALQQFFAAALATLGQLLQVVGNLGHALLGILSSAQATGGGLVGLLVQVSGALAGFTNSVQGQQALQVFFGSAAQLARLLLPLLLQLAAIIGNTVAPALAQLGTALVQGGGLQALITGLGQGLAALAPALAPLGNAVSALLAAAAPLLPVIGQLAGALLTVLANTVAQLATNLQPVIAALAELAQQLVPLLPAIGQMLSLWIDLESVGIPLVVQALHLLADVLGFAVSGWVSAAGVVQQFHDAWRALGGGIQGTTTLIALAATGMVDSVGRNLGPDGLLGFFLGLPARILTALGNLGGLLVQAGHDLVEGMIRGVSEMVGRLLDRAAQMARDAVATVKQALGIASPSTVFAALGRFTAQGFAQGITDATPFAVRAAGQLADAATFDPTRAEFGFPTTAGPQVTVNQTITAQPDQSPWSIATAANRQLGYAMRTAGIP